MSTALTFRNYINGEWIDGPTFESRNPANTDEIVAKFVKGSPADVEAAADAAAAALPAWSAMNAPARGALLYKVADILESRFNQLGEEMTREEGKTLPRSQRRSPPRHQYFPLLRRRRLPHARHARPQ
jgi:alpha-ketoglutaric semialdehyde dehydrogenase